MSIYRDLLFCVYRIRETTKQLVYTHKLRDNLKIRNEACRGENW